MKRIINYIRKNYGPTYLDHGFKSINEMESFNRRVLYIKEQSKRAFTVDMILKVQRDYNTFLLPFATRKSVYINKAISEAIATVNTAQAMINDKVDWNRVVYDREQILVNGKALTKNINY